MRDLLAGITVALVLIPQSLAYAGVAGMPAVSGLYAAALPPIAAALFASSPYLQTGPVATTSLLTLGALAGRAPLGSEAYMELGMLLALVVGVTRVLIGVLRAGVVAHLMSEPMLMGFMPGAAILIVASQLPAVLGVSADGDLLAATASALAHPAAWDPLALAFAAGVLAVTIVARRVHRLVPAALLALVSALVVNTLLGSPGATVGAIPAGLPHLTAALPYGELPSLLVPGVVIALVGFAEAASVARTYAVRERQRWSADREFIGQGAANLAAGLSGGYPVGGSLSRTSLNHSAGAATRRSGAITGLAVLAFLPVAFVLAPLPKAVLAAIVISTVVRLIRLRRVVALWHVSRPQLAVAATTLGLTLLLPRHLEIAVLAGVGLSIAVHLARELTVSIQVRRIGDVLEVRPTGVLWFATTADVEERLIDALERHSDLRLVRLSLDGLGRVDLAGAIAIVRTVDNVRAGGVEVEVTGVPPQAEALFERYGRRRAALD